MFTTILTADDKFLVLASDGILDFLTNQQIIDICARSDSPLMACQSLVESAYDQWITHKKRSDDITTIVCFLECDRSSDNDETLGDLVALA